MKQFIKEFLIAAVMPIMLVLSSSVSAVDAIDDGTFDKDTQQGNVRVCNMAFDHDMKKLHSSNDIPLCELTANRPLLIINTASHCGFTPQFEQLEAIHKEYQEKGLVVLGFASNSFKQEAKSEEAAAEICHINYGVTFTMLAPSPVRGKDANPVFQWLAEKTKAPRWNFNKYLVSADRNTVQHFGSMTKPSSEKFRAAIESMLNESS